MRYHCLGMSTDRYGNVSYAILDEMVNTVDFKSSWGIRSADREFDESIGNLKIIKDAVEFSNGAVERYGVWDGSVIKKHVVIVLRKYADRGKPVGYKVYGTDRGMQKMTEAELISYGELVGIANAKIVEKQGGKKYIASISGEFETEEVPKEGQRLTAEDFVSLMVKRGCKVTVNGSVVEVSGDMKELVFENLSIPEFGNRTVITFMVSIKIKNMTMVGNNTLFVGFGNSYVENLILDGRRDMHEITIEKIPVLRVITKGIVGTISKVNIVRGFKEFIGGEKLNNIQESLDAGYLEMLDLRECKWASSVSRSFNTAERKSRKDVRVWLGRFVEFRGVLEGCSVEFMDFFNKDTTHIDGFSKVVGMKKLELGSYGNLGLLRGMDDSEFEEVILPQQSESRHILIEDFMSRVKLECVDIPIIKDCAYLIRGDSFLNADVIRIGGNVSLGVNKEMSKKKFIIKKKGVIVYMPYLVPGELVSAEIEEGTEIVAFRGLASSKYMDLKFPKSLREIQSGAFEGAEIWSMNLEETGLEKVGDKAFKDMEFKGDIILLPETVNEIGVSAFSSEHIEKMYVPKSVSSIGKMFFKGDILYTVKGCLVDKTRKGSYVKIYVDNLEGLGELLREKNSTDRELAKVTMTTSGKEQYEWLKEEKYRENAKFLLKLEKEFERVGTVENGVVLDTSKYIDFSLEKLGLVGVEIGRLINEEQIKIKDTENKGLTDTFKVLSNIITNNTKFYAGHFTTKALKRFGETKEEVEHFMANAIPQYLYSDRGASIVLFPLSTVGNSRFIKDTLAVLIVIGGNIRYTTLIRVDDNFMFDVKDMEVKGVRIEDYLSKGDKISRKRGGKSTLGLIELPFHMANSLKVWVRENMLEPGDYSGSINYISRNTGNLYRMKNYDTGVMLMKAIKPEQHRYALGKELMIRQEGCFRYFDLINGVVKPEKRIMKSKQTEIAVICEKLAGEYTRAYGNELVEMILESIDKVVVEVPVKKLRRALMKTTSMEDYAVIEMNSQEAINKLGYSRNFGKTYIISKKKTDWYKEDGTTEGFLVAHDIAELVSRKYMLKLDSSVPKPKLMQVYHVEDVYKYFVNPCMTSKNIGVMTSKHDGKPYLMITGNYTPKDGYNGNTRINLGELRDEIEALKMIKEGLSEDVFMRVEKLDTYALTLADEARRGLIPVGAHPEYTINTHKIYEVLGL